MTCFFDLVRSQLHSLEVALNHPWTTWFFENGFPHLHLSTPFSGFDLRIRFGLHLWSWLGPGKVTLLIQFLENLWAVATCCKAKARWFCIQPPVVPLEGRVVPLSLPGRPEPLSYDAFDSCSKIGEACGPQFLRYTRLHIVYHSVYICTDIDNIIICLYVWLYTIYVFIPTLHFSRPDTCKSGQCTHS